MLEDSDKGPVALAGERGRTPLEKRNRNRNRNIWCQAIRTCGFAEDPRSEGKDGKIKSSKGEGKKGKSKDAGALAWTEQLMCDQASGTPVASTAASSAQ